MGNLTSQYIKSKQTKTEAEYQINEQPIEMTAKTLNKNYSCLSPILINTHKIKLTSKLHQISNEKNENEYELFIKSITCVIGKGILYDVYSCHCSSCSKKEIQNKVLFCYDCIIDYLKVNETCPFDNQTYMNRSMIVYEKKLNDEVNRLPVFCPIRSKGCYFEGSLFDLKIHILTYNGNCNEILFKNTGYNHDIFNININNNQNELSISQESDLSQYDKLKKCKNSKCFKVMNKKMRKYHMKYECEYRIVKCEKCSEDIEYNQILFHMNYHDNNEKEIETIKEKEREKDVSSCIDLSNNDDKDLLKDNETVNCLFSQFGCDKKCLKSQLKSHLTEEFIYHENIILLKQKNENNNFQILSDECKISINNMKIQIDNLNEEVSKNIKIRKSIYEDFVNENKKKLKEFFENNEKVELNIRDLYKNKEIQDRNIEKVNIDINEYNSKVVY